MFLDPVSAGKSPQSFYHNCLLAIQKQSLHEKKQVSPKYLGECVNQKRIEESQLSNDITQALFATADRRYGVNNHQPKFQRKNPMRDGKVMKCRDCDSEYRFIRNCPHVKEAVLGPLETEQFRG